jgi:hypothetical protein
MATIKKTVKVKSKVAPEAKPFYCWGDSLDNVGNATFDSVSAALADLKMTIDFDDTNDVYVIYEVREAKKFQVRTTSSLEEVK